MISKRTISRLFGVSALALTAAGCANVNNYYGNGIQEVGTRSILFPETMRDTKFVSNAPAASQERIEALEESPYGDVSELGKTSRTIAKGETKKRLDQGAELDNALTTVRSKTPKAKPKATP